MQGLILVFNDQKQVGAIATQDGQRYQFPIKDWQEELATPERGLKVEFDVGEDNCARNIRLALPDSPAPMSAASTQEPMQTAHSPIRNEQIALKPKKKSILTLLGVFLGAFGAHKFYLGAWGWGIVYILALIILVGLTALHPLFELLLLAFTVLIAVEWVRYILMSDAQFEAKLSAYRAQRPGPFSFFW